jgi:hypothetical protein
MISDPVSSNGPVIGRDGRVAEGARLESAYSLDDQELQSDLMCFAARALRCFRQDGESW